MARPTLRHHRKFRHLARLLKSEALAWGSLELLWHVAYDQCDDLIGTAEDVEKAMMWQGKPGRALAAVVDSGFVDATDRGYIVHDLWDHAPDYVQRRAEREAARRAKGQTISQLRAAAGRKGAAHAHGKRLANDDTCQPATLAKDATPAPSTQHPLPAPAPAPTSADVTWCADDLWQAWRVEAEAQHARQPLSSSMKDYEHLRALMESYTETQLRQALHVWWASPFTGGRNLGLFRSQIGEVFEHLAAGNGRPFRAPPPKTVNVAQQIAEGKAKFLARTAMR